MPTLQQYQEDTLKKFDELIEPMNKFFRDTDKVLDLPNQSKYSFDKALQSFLKEALKGQLEVVKNGIPEITVSWDIADGGSEWVVQFWQLNKDGTKTLIQQLDKNSDTGGNFSLSSIQSLNK